MMPNIRKRYRERFPSKRSAAFLSGMIVIAFFLWNGRFAAAETYYVSPAGDDAGDGLSVNSPWRTIGLAMERIAPGDRIRARGGVYHEAIGIGGEHSGTPTAPKVLEAYPGETPILDGTGVESRYPLSFGGDPYSQTPGASWWVIDGLTIRDYVLDGLRAAGVSAWYGNHGITLRNLDISGVETCVKFIGESDDLVLENIRGHDYTGAGIDLGSHLVEDNRDIFLPMRRVRMSRVTMLGPRESNDTAVDGFAIEVGEDVIVEDCVSEGHPGDGFDFKSHRTVLRRVRSSFAARNGIKLWGREARLEDSLSHDSGLEALVLEPGGSYEVTNCTIANAHEYGYTVGIGLEEESNPVPMPVRLRNNIFSADYPGNGGVLLLIGAGVQATGERNLYYAPQRADAVIRWSGGELSSAGFPTPWGPEDRYGDPLFVSPETGNFHLRPGSPAIGQGIMREGSTDLDGVRRGPGASDFGCYTSGTAAVPVKGDLDGNGRVNVADAILALRAAVGLMEAQPEQVTRGDIDGDGAIRVPDVIRILRIVLGL